MDLIENLKKIFDKNLIPYMEMQKDKNNNCDVTIKVYFPKIMLNICTFLDKNFLIEDKNSLYVQKDMEGYPFVELTIIIQDEKKKIRVNSILKNTWGIANNY